MNDPTTKRGFRWWSKWFLRASYLLMWGLSVTAIGSEGLLQDRFANAAWPWSGTIHAATFATTLWTLWMLWALWPLRESDSPTGNKQAAVFFLVLCVGVATWQREHLWAVVGTGLVCAPLLACLTEIYQRSLALAVCAWGLAGFAVLLLPWPNGQRFDLIWMLGGLATALQGAIGLSSDLMSLRRRSQNVATNSY